MKNTQTKFRFIAMIIILLMVISVPSFSQISYTYDDAGNMVKRTVILLRKARPDIDNTKQDTDNNNQDTDNTQQYTVQKNLSLDVYQSRFDINKITIYPNPTKGQLKIDITNVSSDAQMEIQVYDVVGKLVLSEQRIGRSNIINLLNHPSGVYIMKLKINEKVKEWKIIKE